MEIKLDNLEMLTILNGLESLHDQAKEYREVTYDTPEDFLIDFNNIRALHNKLLIQAQNEGVIYKEVNLI